jgi:hypothetical protein
MLLSMACHEHGMPQRANAPFGCICMMISMVTAAQCASLQATGRHLKISVRMETDSHAHVSFIVHLSSTAQDLFCNFYFWPRFGPTGY